MHLTTTVMKRMSKLPRVQIDDTLLTIMLLNDRPIIAVASALWDDGGRAPERRYCHIIRVGEQWAKA